MPLPAPHFDPAAVDCSKLLFDQHAIREYLPHRPPMEMLSAIVHIDRTTHLVIGYLDVATNAFWVPGHFPNFPLMPGVLMCEAAAQLTAVYTLSTGITQNKMMGLGGIENTRFRRAVRPGERLLLVGKGLRVRPRMTQFNVQGYVGTDLAFDTEVIGVSLASKVGEG